MTEEQKEDTPEIWVPPEKIDANTQRMAWLLFLEVWKATLATSGNVGAPEDESKQIYSECLKAAKIVRRLEQGEG